MTYASVPIEWLLVEAVNSGCWALLLLRADEVIQ